MATAGVATGKSTAGDLDAWICFEDEAGQGTRPPTARTWGRRGHTPVITVILLIGSETLTFFRLWTRAPRTIGAAPLSRPRAC